MRCWLIADESATRAKIAAAKRHNVKLVTGGGPFEIAKDRGMLEGYLELCAGLGIDRIAAGDPVPDRQGHDRSLEPWPERTPGDHCGQHRT